MDKRVLLTIALSIAILLIWFKLFPNRPPEAPLTPMPVPAPVAPSGVAGGGTTASPGAAAAPSATRVERPAEQRVVVERPGFYRAVFSTWGAVPKEFTLLHPQYRERVWLPKPEYVAKLPPGMPAVRQGDQDPNFERKLVPINLIKPGLEIEPFSVSFPESDFSVDPAAAWTLARQTDEELVFALDVGGIHLEKKWRLPRSGYALGLDVSVENRSERSLNQHLQMMVTSWQDPTVKPSAFSFGQAYDVTDVACDLGGKVERKNLEDAIGEPFSQVGDVKWVGTGSQYFLMAAAFGPEPGAQRRCSLRGDARGYLTAEAYFAERRLAPGASTSYAMAAFLGPKLLNSLDDVKVGGGDAKLGDAVNYTLEFVARPMLWLLQQIQKVTVNWGLAIIVFTLLLKLVTFYPTQSSMKSMRAMAALKPKMDAIRERYKDDKQRQNQEVMSLYKGHGVNPLGGCLPTLIQMPIYIAFYSMLANAVELYHASFVGPINDMTAPYWPLAVVTGALMFLQAKLSPQSPDSQQQRMMMYMMPVMFTAFTVFLPSGLTLYILANTLLTMAQQWWFNRRHPLPVLPATAKSGRK